MTQDEDHLRLLSIFHYVVAGLAGLFSLFPIFHLVLGLFFIFAPDKFAGGKGPPPPAFIGWMFVIFAIVFITVGLIFAGFVMTNGRFLAKRKHYMFCMVMGGIECIFMPFGTVLGVVTIIVLMRDSVKAMFAANALGKPPSARQVLLAHYDVSTDILRCIFVSCDISSRWP